MSKTKTNGAGKRQPVTDRYEDPVNAIFDGAVSPVFRNLKYVLFFNDVLRFAVEKMLDSSNSVEQWFDKDGKLSDAGEDLIHEQLIRVAQDDPGDYVGMFAYMLTPDNLRKCHDSKTAKETRVAQEILLKKSVEYMLTFGLPIEEWFLSGKLKKEGREVIQDQLASLRTSECRYNANLANPDKVFEMLTLREARKVQRYLEARTRVEEQVAAVRAKEQAAAVRAKEQAVAA